MYKVRKTPSVLDCPLVLSEEHIAVEDDNTRTASIMADKDILEFVQSSKNIIDADSDDENEIKNAAPVPTSSEMGNIMKSMHSYFDAHSNGEMDKKRDEIEQFDAKTKQNNAKYILQDEKIFQSPHCRVKRFSLYLVVAAVDEWYGYRTVACLVTSSSPVPQKTRHVGQRCTLNLSRAETSSRWCGVVVRRGGASSGVVHVT
ncbi:uncharacterized protein TNCV_4782191 [Trichonephila clavipes]|nr:uncharacterized protein TNCV_4782191 [Trichonephila clavipes]